MLPILFSGCANAIVGAGSSVSLAALEERSARRIAQDIAISSEIRLKLLNAKNQKATLHPKMRFCKQAGEIR